MRSPSDVLNKSLSSRKKEFEAPFQAGDRKLVLEAMEEYAKDQIFEFSKFKESYQHEEKKRYHKIYQEKGMISWVPASDERLYELFKQQSL